MVEMTIGDELEAKIAKRAWQDEAFRAAYSEERERSGIAQLNPVVHLIAGFRWTFFGLSGDNVAISLGVTAAFIVVLLGIVGWMFRTGFRLKN